MDTSTYNELIRSIEHWNEYRVPILRISQPDKGLNFQGAMRFYFQDSGQKVATKCVNVTSADTTKDVIDVLIEKFRPDMRMLSVPEYGLYEIHENGDERKLAQDEKPIYVQLEWNKDDREGRFLLRRMDEKTRDLAAQNEEPSLKRKLSKKEKKKQEKLKKQQQKEEEKAASKLASKNKNGIAAGLYNELPETSFTRSISNPEAVMKRRRAQKLEKRLQEFSLEGGQEAGGTLRIFGEAINKDVSYKTLLLSTKDTASSVVKQILEKYGKDSEDPSNYCLVQLIVPPSATSIGSDNNSVHDLNTSNSLKESILDDQDCPLLINQNHDKSKGILTFHIRHKPADYQKRRKKKPSRAQVQQNPFHPLVVQQLHQRLQMNNINNNNSEQYRDQNSPLTSSQTSGSINHDLNNPPPPPFETVHSTPTMFPTRNGTGMMYYQQQQQPHSISTSTLPSRINNHSNVNHVPDFGGTMQSSPAYPQQPNVLNHHNGGRHFAPNHIIPSNPNYPPANQPNQQYVQATGANDQILPALIQVKEDVEDIFLSRVITHIMPTDITFRLVPTYVLYMVSRYRASTLFHPELQAPSRAELFMPFTKKIATLIKNAIESHIRDPTYLSFWLANSSDLSHFYKQDKHLSHFTIDAQEILNESIKTSFKYLLSCKQLELDAVLHSFFDEREDNVKGPNDRSNPVGHVGTFIDPILEVLNETMATMRKNRVNAALTIQIFSHLFHHVSKWLFDRLIGVYDNQPGLLGNQQDFSIYCNRLWGEKLKTRLAAIGSWAEKQGLEQAADFHLTRVIQVTQFLRQNYPTIVSPSDLIDACDSCDKLNPIQLRALLKRYQPDQPIVGAMIANLLYTNYSYIPGHYPLEEDPKLKIPFLIPEDGYSSDMIRYIPNGLLDFVSYLSKIRVKDQELCIFTVQPTSSGYWTVYFKNHQPDAPEIIVIQLRKMNNSMGLSIIAAKGAGQERCGIYIKNVVKNGAAALDGRLQAGDQLLEVDGNSLINISQEQAAELMMRTGPVVTLRIAKQAALYYNVSDIINSVPNQTIVSTQAPVHMPQVHHQQKQINHNIHHHHHQQQQQQQQQQQHHQPQHHQQHLPQNQHPNIHHQQHQMTAHPPPPQAFIPPAPAPLDPIQSVPPPVNVQSPMKSPKKVSWLDTQPHQSLHTLIPLPYDSEHSDNAHSNSDGHDDSVPNFNDHIRDHQEVPLVQEEEDEDDEDHSSSSSDEQDQAHENGSSTNATTNGQNEVLKNGQADVTNESLTLEDIDEVLSSKTHNTWLEDSAGVIGTQEVYNDPRQRIIKEKERPNAEVNIEKLSFQEKLKMFNLSAKK